MELVVPPGSTPLRLDRFVATHVAAASRRRAKQHARAFRVNGQPAQRSTIVRPGDLVTIPDDLVVPPEATPNPDLEVDVLFEDGAVVAVDKPAGVSSVALRRGDPRSIAGFLVARFPDVRGIGSPLDGGLVHRLDRETSGVLVAARTSDAYADLRAQFASGAVMKEYIALVEGDVAETGWVRTPIAHVPRHPARMRVCVDRSSQEALKARPAATFYQPEVRYGLVTLLRITIQTGVMHQIRVHLASIRHPVVGDGLYGNRRRSTAAANRHMLHACRIRLRHPVTGAPLLIESPLPADIERILRTYTGGAKKRPPVESRWSRRANRRLKKGDSPVA